MNKLYNIFNANGVGGSSEIGTSLENFGNDIEGYKLDENQTNYIEDTLRSEGISNAQDFDGVNMEDLVDAVDKRTKSIVLDLPSKVHMGYFGKESDVWKEFRSRLEPKYLEAPSDKVQQERIAATMCDMEELRFENWTNLSMESKVEKLNLLEKKIAMIEHRPATTIRTEVMEDGLFGYQLNGDIAINEKLLMTTNLNPEALDKMLETFIHEGRHAYQQYNVEERIVHQSKAQVESWRENFEEIGYWDGGEPIRIPIIGSLTYTDQGLAKLGARLYYYQPVEIDARVFATDTMSAYHKHLNA